jgi:hypothetical protein
MGARSVRRQASPVLNPMQKKTHDNILSLFKQTCAKYKKMIKKIDKTIRGIAHGAFFKTSNLHARYPMFSPQWDLGLEPVLAWSNMTSLVIGLLPCF